jgi:hypothetical protein
VKRLLFPARKGLAVVRHLVWYLSYQVSGKGRPDR